MYMSGSDLQNLVPKCVEVTYLKYIFFNLRQDELSSISRISEYLTTVGRFSGFYIESHRQTLNNFWKSLGEITASKPTSDRLAKELKKTGLRFVGSTICYAFMQSSGDVNDLIKGWC